MPSVISVKKRLTIQMRKYSPAVAVNSGCTTRAPGATAVVVVISASPLQARSCHGRKNRIGTARTAAYSLRTMSQFRCQGIAAALAAEVRSSMRSPQYGHPAYRELAQGAGPCRLCLRTFAIGKDERILFTYQPFLEPGSLPAPGPVFIHAHECARY